MKKLHLAFLISLAIASFSSARAEDSEAAKKETALLQGEWTMVSGSADGQAIPETMRAQMKRVCKGDETTITVGNQVFFKAKFSVDPSKKPKTIDYEMTEGFTKGQKQLGIYELEGDTIKAAFGKPGAERPSDFTSRPGDGHTVSTWKRAKPAEPATGKK